MFGKSKNQIIVFFAGLDETIHIDEFGINRDAIGKQVWPGRVNREPVHPSGDIRQGGDRACALVAAQERRVRQEDPDGITADMLHQDADDIDRRACLNEEFTRLDLAQDVHRAAARGVDDLNTCRRCDDRSGDVDRLARRDEASIGIDELVDVGHGDLHDGTCFRPAQRRLREGKTHRARSQIGRPQIIVLIIGEVIALPIALVFRSNQGCRRIFVIRSDIDPVEIHPPIEHRDGDSRDLQLGMGIVDDLNACVFWRIKQARAAQVIREDPDPSGLSIDRVDHHKISLRHQRNDRRPTAFGQTHIDQLLLEPGDLLGIEGLQIIIVGIAVEREFFPCGFDLLELRRDNAGPQDGKADLALGFIPSTVERTKILGDRPGFINLQNERLEALLPGQDLAIIAHFAEEHGATFAIARAHRTTAQGIGHTRGPVGRLRHPLDAHIAPAIGVDVDVAGAFDACP